MVRIAIVIPYASMASLAQEVFQEHTAQMRLQQRDSTDYSLEIIVAPTTQELLPQMPDCDAMIVRGATYLDLCRNALSVPVIELIINGTDIVNMLLQLRQKYGSVPAAVLGTQNMILGVEKLARQIMSKGPRALMLAKIAVNYGAETDINTGLMIERLAQTIAFSTEDRKEGTAAFLEKRSAHFTGR